MSRENNKIWHSIEKEVVFRELDSKESGLSDKEAKERLKNYGPNRLQIKSAAPIFHILVRQLQNPLIYVLLFSICLALILGRFRDSLVVLIVVILNTIIGFFQEYQAHRSIKALTMIIPEKTSVIREGKMSSIHSSELVPGDVVVLEAGDRIAADLRLFMAKNLECNEGESFPVNKKVESLPINTLLAERNCMAFNGTYVTSGTALGVVVCTGLNTEFGKIFDLVEQVEVLETPMEVNIKKIAYWITWGVLLVSVGLFFIGYLRGANIFDASFSAITLAVAAIPEGLPAIITIAASIGVRRMVQKRAVIRQLPAVEALGSTSVICTDKTGTLTYNEMMVKKIWTPSGLTIVSGAGYSLEGSFDSMDGVKPKEIEEILTAAILCSDASLNNNTKEFVSFGDPTEIALVIAGRKNGLMEDLIREKWHRKDVIPFEPEKRRMATLIESPEGENMLFIKGAPEEIVPICDLLCGKTILEEANAIAKEGIRVLAIAKKKIEKFRFQIREDDLKENFTLLGFIGMIDPIRKEVYQAIRSCHEAGIQIKMVTGDHPLTAESIASDLGILDNRKIITGRELNDCDATKWKNFVTDNQVFARVEPRHKLKLVEVLQQLGHVVAMTGDGVNDAAALKRADIGIAMGIKGTAVAKEASDMILADDNFASIEAAIEEGRRVYDNLVKALSFVLTTSLGQAWVVFLGVIFFPIQNGELVQPILTTQILWINLIVAVALSLPLAFETAEPNIMKRPPRKKDIRILNGFFAIKISVVSLIMAVGSVSLFFWKYHHEVLMGTPQQIAIREAQTMAVTTLVLFQVIYLFNCRSLTGSVAKDRFFSNYLLFIGVGLVLFAQLAFVYLPFMNLFFTSSQMDLESWLISLGVILLIIPILFLEKRIKVKE